MTDEEKIKRYEDLEAKAKKYDELKENWALVPIEIFNKMQEEIAWYRRTVSIIAVADIPNGTFTEALIKEKELDFDDFLKAVNIGFQKVGNKFCNPYDLYKRGGGNE